MASSTAATGQRNVTKKPDFTIFSKYAELLDKDLKKKVDVEKDRFLGYTSNTITILDQFPKAIFHLLVLPRVKGPPRTATNLKSLRTLFSKNVPKDVAHEVIKEIAADAYAIKAEIEDNMMQLYRFKWTIHMGFHAVPSMEYVTLY